MGVVASLPWLVTVTGLQSVKKKREPKCSIQSRSLVKMVSVRDGNEWDGARQGVLSTFSVLGNVFLAGFVFKCLNNVLSAL